MQEISSLPDHWGNDYFDPLLRRRDGQTQKFTGYCTDIFFCEAIGWMRRQHEAKKPFLCYLPLNACHGPQWAPKELRESIARQFPKLHPGHIGYLAMLANADENLGKVEAFLKDTGLRDNTIVVFLSDNGGYALIGHYNAGMRGGKSRLAEGGHRVPCFVRWPAGKISGGRDVAGLAQVQDLLPTLLELCGVNASSKVVFDGTSLAQPLRGERGLPDRTLIVQYGPPEPFRMTCVMRGRWRLLTDIKGLATGEPELYDLAADPLQRTNLIDAHADVAKQLRATYDTWWATTEPLTKQRAFISLGHPDGGKAVLNSAEWRENAMHGMTGLREGVKRRGVWDVEVARDGTYEIALRRWPETSGLALRAAAPAWTPRDTGTPDHAGFPAGGALPIASAELRVGDRHETMATGESDRAAVFRLPLKAGRAELEASFKNADGQYLCAAFFVTVWRVD
jgi:arylsulfatase